MGWFDRIRPTRKTSPDDGEETGGGWIEKIRSAPFKSDETSAYAWEEYIAITPEARSKLREVEGLTSAQTTLLVACCGASFAIGFKLGRAQMPWTIFTSVTDIPSAYFGPTAPYLRGRVVSVSDGDTIRFLSAPTVFNTSRIESGQKMSDVALPIRICTIDTPETAKFGKPGQPFGDDAKAMLQGMIDDKIVRVRLLQKDQYGRAVAEVRSGIFPFYKYMDEQMLKAGLAEVYLGSGAVYGSRGKEAYLGMQKKAEDNRKGMWSQGKERESAAEFKARMKAT